MSTTTKPKKKVSFGSPVTIKVTPEFDFVEFQYSSESENNSKIKSTCTEAGSDREDETWGKLESDEDTDEEVTSSKDNENGLDNPPSGETSSDSEATTEDEAAVEKMAEGKSKVEVAIDASDDNSSAPAPKWTAEEDYVLCLRKNEGKSWPEIGKELGRRRRECQQRFRVIRSHTEALSVAMQKLASLYTDEYEGTEEANNDDEKEEKEKKKVTTEKKPKDRATQKTPPPPPTTSSSPSSSSSGSSSDSDSDSDSDDDDKHHNNSAKENRKPNKGKAKDEKKKKETKQQKQEPVPTQLRTPASDVTLSPTAHLILSQGATNTEFWEQQRYACLSQAARGVHGMQEKVLRPDGFYSELDCQLLVAIEARYRALKWLHIQASFCNATGRMIDADMLWTKFYEE